MENKKKLPKSIGIFPHSIFYWNLKSTVPELRINHGTRFCFILGSIEVEQQYRELCDKKDKIYLFGKHNECELIEKDVYNQARRLEIKYGINYMLDIIQKDRFLFTKMSNTAPNNMHAKMKQKPFLEITNDINRYILWLEKIFKTEKFDLVIGWPISYQDACSTIIAERLGLLVTYPYPAKLENYVFWATGSEVKGYQHEHAFKSIKNRKIKSACKITMPKQPAKIEYQKDATELYTTKRTLYEIIKHVYEHLFLFIDDIKCRRNIFKVKRVSLFSLIFTRLNAWVFFNKYIRLCEKNLSKIAENDYVFFALHQDPEFTVQSQSYKFNDQEAIIKHLLKSLPIGVKLVIKEHITLGNRKIDFYKNLKYFPNLIIAGPNIPGIDLVKNSRAVVTLRGTVILEAAIYGIPAFNFVNETEFKVLSNLTTIESFNKMAYYFKNIDKSISKKIKEKYKNDGEKFLIAIKKISYPADTQFKRQHKKLPTEAIKKSIDLLLDLYLLYKKINRTKNIKS